MPTEGNAGAANPGNSGAAGLATSGAASPGSSDAASPGNSGAQRGELDLKLDLAHALRQLHECLEDLQDIAKLGAGDVLVVGASSSEILGERIGSHTSLQVGRAIVDEILGFAEGLGVEVVFQCCEHLNRALVAKRTLARNRGWQEVSAIPVPGAGGALAASAFLTYGQEACLVESVSVDAGIDIGDTFIGMHLKRVAVPIRGRHKEIGHAHVTMARTRPPLIGGVRGVYDETVFQERMGLAAANGGATNAAPRAATSNPGATNVAPPDAKSDSQDCM